MLTGNIDPRRPDKQQRYKLPTSSNNAAPGEDLTPDYMNILDSQKKSMHSSNRSDRFKVVKIESTEPFKRGRWECMDFLDQSYNRIFQHNYVAYKTSDTNGQTTLNSSLIEPPKTPSTTSWGSNIDLQSSMLQIFYRQNNNITNTDVNKEINLSQNVSELSSSLNRVLCCGTSCMQATYSNHVLRPGMVSSSLRGVKYPLELNFPVNEDIVESTVSNITGALSSLTNDLKMTLPHKQHIYNQVCVCNTYSTDVVCNQFQSNVEKLHNMTAEHQQFIQNDLLTTTPGFPKCNYVQQNFPVQSKGDFVYQATNGLTSNSQSNLNLTSTSPSKHSVESFYQEQINSCHAANNIKDVQGFLTVPLPAQNSELSNKGFEGDTSYQIDQNGGHSLENKDNNDRYVSKQNYVDHSLNMSCSFLNYQEQMNYQEQRNYPTQNNIFPAINTSASNLLPNLSQLPSLSPLPNLSQLQNLSPKLPAADSNLCINQSQINLDLCTNNNGTTEQLTTAVKDMDQLTDNQNFNKESLTKIPPNNITLNEPNNEAPATNTQPSATNIKSFPYTKEQIQYLTTNQLNNISANSSIANMQGDYGNKTNIRDNESTNNQNPDSSSTFNMLQSNSMHPNTGSNNCFNTYSPENLSMDSQLYVPTYIPNSFVLPLIANQYHVPICLPTQNMGNNAMPKSAEQSTSDATISQGYILIPHSINAGFLSAQQPKSGSQNLNFQSQREEVAACVHSFLADEKASAVCSQNNDQSQNDSLPRTIDTKIEALMDLVKKHLKVAVLEDVNVLKQRILMLKERIAHLEYENELLKRCDCPHNYKNNI